MSGYIEADDNISSGQGSGLAMKDARCKRCGRPLKSPISIKRGYGPTCYAKVTKERSKVTEQIPDLNPEPDNQIQLPESEPEDRIHQLETEIELLKKKVDAIQAMPATPLAIPMPTPSSLPSIPSADTNSLKNRPKPIPLNVGGWDVSELKENKLFLKMKALADSNE